MAAQLLIVGISLVPLYLLVGVLAVHNWLRSRTSRLPFDIATGHRIAGYSLLRQYNDLGIDMFGHLFMLQLAFFLPFIAYAVSDWMNQRFEIWIYVVILPFVVIYASIKATRTIRQRTNIRLGLEAEWFIANQLNELTDSGYRSFHDIQADKFNIDHLVVGPNGVFAVETKGRRKPGSAAKADPLKDNSHHLSLDGEQVIFPVGTDTQMVPQAIRQAKWCSQWLTQACGFPIAVTPVLALPGWFINRKKRHAIAVLSGKEIPKSFLTLKGQPLTPEQRHQVIWQIKQRIQRESDQL